MKTSVNAFVVSLLIVNITVGIVLLVVTRPDNEQKVNDGSISAQNFKKTVDTVYMELLAKGDEKPEHETDDVTAMNMSSQMVNLLKPIAFYTGLNNTGLVKEDNLRVTPARGWAAQVMVAPERQLLYNGMQNDHGSIIVPAAGVYMVYSHVTFHTDKSSDFCHRITRYNAEKQEEDTAFQDIVSGNRHSVKGGGLVLPSDIRGILQLNAGDQLRVDISRVNQSGYEKDWYYFGLYKI